MTERARPVVLLVDRDVYLRRLVRQFLDDQYEVLFHDDGYTALDAVRRLAPAAVVTEILLPELDGLALCRLLKGDPTTRQVPVVIASMLASSARATAAGADAFLNKPIERARLTACLAHVTKAGRPGALSPLERSAK